MITTTCDPEADALYVYPAGSEVRVEEAREVDPGVMLDIGANRQVIGIEVLDVRTRVSVRNAAATAE